VDGLIKSELYAGAGNDQIQTTGNVQSKVYLGDGNDAFKSDGHLQDELSAGSGNDVVLIGKHLQNKAYLGSGNDILVVAEHLKDEAFGDSGNDYISIGGKVQNKVYMGSGDDFLFIGDTIENEVHGGDGNDSLCLGGYTSANWINASDDIYSFENIKTSDGVIVQGSADAFGNDCEFNGGSGYQYRYPITLTVTPKTGYSQVSTVLLENTVPGSDIEGGTENDDGSYTLTVNISNQVEFNLLSDTVYADDGLEVDVGAKWVQREQVVTITLKESSL